MPTTTLDTMLPEFGRYMGAFLGSFTTTTAIGATGSLTVVISTELKDFGFTSDDGLNDTFIKITSENNDDVVRRVTDYTASSGTITISGTDLTSDSSTQATFEIYRYDPDQLRNTLNDARLEVFPRLYKEINDRTLTLAGHQDKYARPTSIRQGFVRQIYEEPRIDAKSFANNIVSTLNCDFESSTIGDDWTASYITLAAETETTSPDNWMVFSGTQSGKCTVTASQTATLLMTVPSGTNYVGEEINVGIWVYSRTASRVSATIVLDSTASVGSTHSGGGWERLTHTLVADGVSSSIKVGVSSTSGTAFVFYADEIIATSGQSELPQPIGSPIMGWREETDNIIIHGHKTSADRQLRVRGMGLLSSVSSGSDTMEIEYDQLRILYAHGAMLWFQQDIDQLDTADLNAAQIRYRHFRSLAEQGRGAMAPMPLLKGVY